MNRRDFFKSAAATLAGLSIPLEFGGCLTIVDYKIVEELNKFISMGKCKIENGRATTVEVSIDDEMIWQAVRLVDEDGREWHTNDEGITWHCGLMSFEIPKEVTNESA